ncbi:hypothetical protein QPK13_03705 [Photorhabdus tasmaniensis]
MAEAKMVDGPGLMGQNGYSIFHNEKTSHIQNNRVCQRSGCIELSHKNQ